MSIAGMLAALFSLVAAALVVLVMPWWASLALALALPLAVALGGAALLGQVLAGAGIAAAIFWLARRRLRRQPREVSIEELKLRSSAARPKTAQPPQRQRRAA